MGTTGQGQAPQSSQKGQQLLQPSQVPALETNALGWNALQCPGVLTVLLPIHLAVLWVKTTSGRLLFSWLSSGLGTRRHSVTVG